MKFLCQFGLNPSSGSGDIVQTKSYADAYADGIHTKNNMSPTPSEGGHNKPHIQIVLTDRKGMNTVPFCTETLFNDL